MVEKILTEESISRPFYLEMIKKYLGTPLIKVITGQRRVGKSTLLKQTINYLIKEKNWKPSQVFYINMEIPQYNMVRSNKDLYDLMKPFIEKQKGKFLIAIDEIQEIEGWEKVINGILTEYKNSIDIIITGSNSHLLSGELATFISGRYVEIQVYPLSYKEFDTFRQTLGEEKLDKKELFNRYLTYGGLPGIFEVKQEDEVMQTYLKSVYNTIVLKDIVERFVIKNIDFFDNLYKYVFATIGNIFSAKNISDYLKSQKIHISVDSVLNYLLYGEKTFILHKVKSEDPKSKKYFTIYNKYYIGDLGLRNSLVGYTPAKDIGGILENVVYLLLKKYNFEVTIGRLPDGREIDFIARKNNKILYIQVATSILDEKTLAREYASLEELDDNWEKIVTTLDEFDFGIKNGIKHVNIMDIENVVENI